MRLQPKLTTWGLYVTPKPFWPMGCIWTHGGLSQSTLPFAANPDGPRHGVPWPAPTRAKNALRPNTHGGMRHGHGHLAERGDRCNGRLDRNQQVGPQPGRPSDQVVATTAHQGLFNLDWAMVTSTSAFGSAPKSSASVDGYGTEFTVNPPLLSPYDPK